MKHKRFSGLLLRSDGAVSVAVVLLGFLAGTVLVMAVGRNPVDMYKSILQVLTGFYQNRRGEWNWEIRYIGDWLTFSVPFILCGLSMGFAARSGLFNIGGEGQYIMGLTVAEVAAMMGPQVPVLHWVLAIGAAAAAGALWGGIVGGLKARFEVSEVVATIMLNYVSLYLSRIITMQIPGANTYRTPDFPATASLRIPLLERLTNGSPLNMGIILAAIALVMYWFVIEKTSLGFGLRATGFNKEAARASGIPVAIATIAAMAFAGAFAGLAGGIVALGSFRYGRVIAGMDNYGFTGIAVALVGNNRALGTALSGLLFGMLASSQTIMQANNIPKEIVYIIQGLIVVFIAIREGLRLLVRRWQSQKSAGTAGTEGAPA